MQQHPDKASPLVVPDVTPEMRAFIPDAFASDLDNPVARLVIQRLIDAGHEPLRNRVQPEGALTASTRSTYEGIIALWLTFVGMSDDEMVALSHDDRCDLADAWLVDCASRLSAATVNHRRAALRCGRWFVVCRTRSLMSDAQ